MTNGVATLQTSFAAAGSYPVTAAYAGDQNNAASTSSAVTIAIAAPDFTIAATPTSASVTPGQTATFTFKVTPVAGYAGTVKFSCGTLPSLVTCSFSSVKRDALRRLPSLQHVDCHHGEYYGHA